jgi:hypothetical protein
MKENLPQSDRPRIRKFLKKILTKRSGRRGKSN